MPKSVQPIAEKLDDLPEMVEQTVKTVELLRKMVDGIAKTVELCANRVEQIAERLERFAKRMELLGQTVELFAKMMDAFVKRLELFGRWMERFDEMLEDIERELEGFRESVWLRLEPAERSSIRVPSPIARNVRRRSVFPAQLPCGEGIIGGGRLFDGSNTEWQAESPNNKRVQSLRSGAALPQGSSDGPG